MRDPGFERARRRYENAEPPEGEADEREQLEPHDEAGDRRDEDGPDDG